MAERKKILAKREKNVDGNFLLKQTKMFAERRKMWPNKFMNRKNPYKNQTKLSESL